MNPAFRIITLTLLLAIASPAAAQDRYLAYLLDEHVGNWELARNGPAFQETLRIVSAQEKGRTTVVDSFALTPEGSGWRWEHRLQAGPINRIERGTIVDGRLWRENDAGERVASIKVPDAMVLPSMRAERIRAYAMAPAPVDAAAAKFAYLDPSRLRPVSARLERCEVDATLAGVAHCVALRLDARSGDELWQLGADGRILRVDMSDGAVHARLRSPGHQAVRHDRFAVGRLADPHPATLFARADALRARARGRQAAAAGVDGRAGGGPRRRARPGHRVRRLRAGRGGDA